MIKLHYPGFNLRLDQVHSAVKSRGKNGCLLLPRIEERKKLIEGLFAGGQIDETQAAILLELLHDQEKTATPKDIEISVRFEDRKLPIVKLYRLSFAAYQSGWYYFALSSNPVSRRNSIKKVRSLAATLEEAIECAREDAIKFGVETVTATYPKVR